MLCYVYFSTMKKEEIDRTVRLPKVLPPPILSGHLFLATTVVNTSLIFCRWADLGTKGSILCHWSHSQENSFERYWRNRGIAYIYVASLEMREKTI